MRKILALSLTAAAALTFAALALTAPSNNDDELLKEEKHLLAQSNKTYDGGQKAMQILT